MLHTIFTRILPAYETVVNALDFWKGVITEIARCSRPTVGASSVTESLYKEIVYKRVR